MIKTLSLNSLKIIAIALAFSCNSHHLPVNDLGDVSKLDGQITIKNWELLGPYLDTASYTWHEFAEEKKNQSEDSLDYANFWNYFKLSYREKTGENYHGEFARFHDASAYAVNAVLQQGNGLFNFEAKKEFSIQFNLKLNKGDKSYSYLRPAILSKRVGFTEGQPGWCFYLEGGMWKFGVGQVNKKNYAVDGAVISDGTWHTITAVVAYRNNIRVISTYTDGNSNSVLRLPADYGNINSTAPVTLGYLPGNIKNPADLYASELKIWNKTLSLDEVQKWGNIKASTPTFLASNNLLGYWPCNEGQDNILKNLQRPGDNFIINGNYEWQSDTSVIGRSLPMPANPFFYHQPNDFIHLNKAFQTRGHDTYSQAGGYASCIINSAVAQNVALLFGMHDAIKIWVNKKLYVRQLGHNLIGKNQYTAKVHLNKGDNEIVAKIYNTANSNWGFHVDISAADYVRKYAIGVDYYSISPQYLIKEHESMILRLKYPLFITTNRRANLQIFDIKDRRVLFQDLARGRGNWAVSLNSLAAGAYRCVLTTDADTIEQKFIYGDYRNIFLNYQERLKILAKTDAAKINIETLYKRFAYLDDFGQRNNYDEGLQRKLSALVFELGMVQERLTHTAAAFSGRPGVHIRGFRSGIDEGTDNYMVCVPKSYKVSKPLPLVIMMPYVTKQAPFAESWHVADIDRIEFIERLCNRYGFAAIWPSSRIYENYNLNPIVSAATFEAIRALKKDYVIDEHRLYLYGDCSGGLQALLIANRFPGLFSAIGVEGPDLSYTANEKNNVADSYPPAWVKQNNLLKMPENYRNIPMLIVHTVHDEKADQLLSKTLAEGILKTGGHVKFDYLNNATKTNKIKMISESIIIANIFKFFNNKSKPVPDTIMFSTYQQKYNQAYWITLNAINNGQKASVLAIHSGYNTFKINTFNVNRLTLNLGNALKVNHRQKLKISLNGEVKMFNYPKSNQIILALNQPNTTRLAKNHDIEGPINDFFSGSFLLIKGTAGSTVQRYINQAASDTLMSNWKYNYFNDCMVRDAKKLTENDLRNYNLILIGTPGSNTLIKKIYHQLPIKIYRDSIRLRGKMYGGSNITYTMVYPNPLNPSKYILLMGTNGTEIFNKSLKDLPLKGFYDYELIDNPSRVKLTSGYFNEKWQ